MQLSHFVRHDGTARLERTDSPTSRRPTGGRGHPVASPPVAQRTILTLEDDIDGGPADTTVRFALDDVTYELDLNCTNADELMKFLTPYIAAAGGWANVSGLSGSSPSDPLVTTTPLLRGHGPPVAGLTFPNAAASLVPCL